MKAQTTIEFVFILAILFIVLAVLLGAIGYFGPPAQNQAKQTYASYWRYSEFAIMGFTWNESNPKIPQFYLQNNLRYSVLVSNISFDNYSFNSSSFLLDSGQNNLVVGENATISPGEYIVTINYQNVENLRNYTFIGSVPFIVE